MNARMHHLDDDVLLDYVTGAASEPVALVAACHLTLCPTCRTAAGAAESIGGALLEHGTAAALSEGALLRVLAKLDDGIALPAAGVDDVAGAVSAGPPIAAVEEPFVLEGVPLPRPLARYLTGGPPSSSAAPPSFRFIAPGVRGIDLPAASGQGARTRLLRLAPGMEIPRHTHAAPEFTLVFSGGLTDDGEHYGRGDIRYRDSGAAHAQRVDPDVPCVALVVNQGALIPQTWRGRLISLLFDR